MKISRKKGKSRKSRRNPRRNSSGGKRPSKSKTAASDPASSLTPLLQILTVVGETDHSVVLNKPALLDCQNSKKGRESVVDWLEEKYSFSGLVHRLDFGTSGLLLCAKNAESAKKLSKLLQDGKVRRIYHAIVLGKNLPASGSFDEDLDGKSAVTHFKKLKTFANATLLEIKLTSGRKHQIRRHFSNAGFPLLGDHRYKKKGSHLLFSRPALHAIRLDVGGETYQIDYPDDFEKLVKRLQSVK